MVRALALSALLSLAGCAGEPPGPAPQSGCSSDADCPVGTRCDPDRLCRAPEGEGGSSGVNACDDAEDCDPQGASVPTVFWDGGEGGGLLCTVPPVNCPGPDACLVPTACLPPLDGADRPGAIRCERDEQCHSGRCLELAGVGQCLRACAFDEDCPVMIDPAGGPPGGLTCATVDDAGISLQSCAPADPAHPERTLCRRPCDCVPADGCDPAAPGELTCRFVVGPDPEDALPSCAPLPPGGGVPTLAQCPEDPATCAGGRCNAACEPNGSNFCTEVPRRCTQPCDRDTDCPPRTACITGKDSQRVGEWPVPRQGPRYRGRDIRHCLPPSLGCYDEIDCCPEPDGQGHCEKGWTADPGRCSVELAPSPAGPRLVTVCKAPDGRAAPGACCGSHATCDSELCVPARPGTPCAGGGVCSVPCDPFPDPDGVPGSGDERDRCALFPFASDYHRTSSCLPFGYEIALEDGTSRVEPLNACQ